MAVLTIVSEGLEMGVVEVDSGIGSAVSGWIAILDRHGSVQHVYVPGEWCQPDV